MTKYGPQDACMVCVRVAQPQNGGVVHGWLQCGLRLGHEGYHEAGTVDGPFQFNEEYHETMIQPRPR